MLMSALVNKGINNGYMLQNEEGNPVHIESLDMIFHEVLEEVRNMKNKFIGSDGVTEK